jgi:hypothetical protein
MTRLASAPRTLNYPILTKDFLDVISEDEG